MLSVRITAKCAPHKIIAVRLQRQAAQLKPNRPTVLKMVSTGFATVFKTANIVDIMPNRQDNDRKMTVDNHKPQLIKPSKPIQ